MIKNVTESATFCVAATAPWWEQTLSNHLALVSTATVTIIMIFKAIKAYKEAFPGKDDK